MARQIAIRRRRRIKPTVEQVRLENMEMEVHERWRIRKDGIAAFIAKCYEPDDMTSDVFITELDSLMELAKSGSDATAARRVAYERKRRIKVIRNPGVKTGLPI